MLRIATEGKGIISLFSVFWSFFYDVMIFDFKFGSNRTASSKNTTHCVAAHEPHSHHPVSGRIRHPCLIRYGNRDPGMAAS